MATPTTNARYELLTGLGVNELVQRERPVEGIAASFGRCTVRMAPAGEMPLLGEYVFGNIPPLTGADFSAIINNVRTRIPTIRVLPGQPSSFQSGNFTLGGPSFGFEFLASGQPTGLKLFTDPSVPFEFSVTFDSLPPSQGTVLMNSGPDVLNVLFGGAVVAQSSNRRILLTAVPEPTSILMLGVGAFGLLVLGRRHQPARGPY